MSMVAVDHDDDEGKIEVRLGTSNTQPIAQEDNDVFSKSVKELRGYNGLSPAVKRSASRQLEKYHRGVDSQSKKIEADGVTGYNLFEVVMPPYNLDYLAQIYEISEPHYAACNAKTANIVGLGFDLVESPATEELLEKTDGEDKTRKLRRKLRRGKQTILEWIDTTNEEDSFVETLIKVWTDYEVTGNGYLEIGRKTNGEIGYIGHVPSTTIRIRRERDGFVQLVGKDAVFFRNFGDQKTRNPLGGDTRPNELIHIKNYSPTNGFYGVPDIIAAKSALAGNEFASRYNLDYFENKAVPRYVIWVKGATLSPASERRLLDFFENGLKGKNHRTLYIPLPPDTADIKTEFHMEAVEAGQQDSSFKNFDAENTAKILMAHRTPISKVGLASGVSLAVARDADKTFKEQVCRPSQKILEKKINKIMKELTDVFLFKLNELTLTDEDTQSKIWERMLRMQVLVPNEVRAYLGLPGIQGGDKVVDLKAQGQAEVRAQAGQTRTRDQARAATSPDKSGEARAPQGEGRQVG
jgi:PBSX family phage portal protein